VVCAADGAYVRQLAAMLTSLVEHLDPRRALSVGIVDGGIPAADRERISRLVVRANVRLRWLAARPHSLAELPVWGRLPHVVYQRLLLPELVREVAHKAIWLDCDIVVQQDVGRLWDIDLADRSLLAAQDMIVPTVSSPMGVARYAELGIPASAKYFNAGVMVVNLARWRDEAVTARVLEYLSRYRNDVVFLEQEGLNAVLAGTWGELDPRWNQNASVTGRPFYRARHLDRATYERLVEDPWIVHFSGNIKPWKIRDQDRYRVLYFKYLDRTPWSGWRPERTVAGTLAARYESARLRNLLYPLERRGLELVRRATRGNGRDRPLKSDPACPEDGLVQPDALSLSPPKLSVVLVTDREETIRRVLDRLCLQTVRHEVELVLVAPASGALDPANLEGFAAVKVVQCGLPIVLSKARAEGIRAASAPLVFIGETHSFPDARMVEELIEAHAGPWTVVTPGFANRNPTGPLSWAGFITDYGAWSERLPAGETGFAPFYNSAFKRSALLEFGSRLESALGSWDEMWDGLRAQGARIYFEPAARIEHLNASRRRSWVQERYLRGRMTADGRTPSWSRLRRLVYACGSPLLPPLYLWRVRRGWSAVRRDPRVPAGTLPAMVLGAVISAAGELVGYARGPDPTAEQRMTQIEVHKAAHVAGEPR